jgi:hypothetical protein
MPITECSGVEFAHQEIKKIFFPEGGASEKVKTSATLIYA